MQANEKPKFYPVFVESEWRVMHPHGCLCNGSWKSEADAQADCNRWNNRDPLKTYQ